MDELGRLQKRLDRESRARKAAEQIAEDTTRRHYATIEELERVNRELVAAQSALERHLAELRTPILRSWEGILTFPMVGPFDPSRAAAFEQTVLAAIEAERAKVSILEMSALGAVEPAAWGPLGRIAPAAALMGCRTILSGMTEDAAAQLAGKELGAEVASYTTQADAFSEALSWVGMEVRPSRR